MGDDRSSTLLAPTIITITITINKIKHEDGRSKKHTNSPWETGHLFPKGSHPPTIVHFF